MPEKLDLGVIGFSGLKQYGGTIDEEWHPKLRGTYGPKLYREMGDNNSAIGAIKYIIQALVRQVEWRVEPADTSKEAAEPAEFLESCLIDMSITFEDFISEVLSFLEFGWSYFEIVYKLRKGLESKDAKTRSQFSDGKIGWRKFALRAQDTLDHWEFDQEDNGLRGMVQGSEYSGKTAFIPIEKAMLFRTVTTKGNPEGRSLYRNAVIDYFYLKRISEIEAIGIERDMTGLITMEVPLQILHPDADAKSKALRASFEKMLSELKRDEREYAMVPAEIDKSGQPTGYKLKLLSTGGRRQIDTNAVKLYYKTGILQSVLAQFIQLGMSNVGSFALASTQTDLFAVALGAYLNTIASVINRFGVSRLMALNGVKSDLWPELVHGDIESPPLAEIGSYVQALAGAGQLPEDDAIKRKLLEIAKLPMPEVEEGQKTEKMSKSGGLVCKHDHGKVEKVVPGLHLVTPTGKCPYCGKPIKGKPRVCPHCGKLLVLAPAG
jgi:hypothetical protein